MLIESPWELETGSALRERGSFEAGMENRRGFGARGCGGIRVSLPSMPCSDLEKLNQLMAEVLQAEALLRMVKPVSASNSHWWWRSTP